MTASSLRPGDTIRVRDERWTVAYRVAAGGASDAVIVGVRGCDRGNRGTRARFLLPFERVERMPAILRPRVVSRGRWRRAARRLLGEASPEYGSLRAAASADIDILPFQLEPALAAVGGAAARMLIADEVGLGKTVQAGLIAAETLERDPDAHLLVLVPASLRDQWAGELRRRFRLSPAVIDSATLARSGPETGGANPWSAHPLVIASIDFVKRPEVLRGLESMVWDVAIVDEAHALAGRSDRHAAASRLAERARLLVLLTATPHPGDENAFARLCGIGDLGRRFPLLVFRRTREDAGLPAARRTSSLHVVPTDAEVAMHAALMDYARLGWRRGGDSAAGAAHLAVSVLARRACSSAASLARSIARRIQLTGTAAGAPAQLALPFPGAAEDDAEPDALLVTPALDDAADERARLEQILALAQRAAASESKVDAIRRLLRRARQPAVIFTEYRDTLAMLAHALEPLPTVELHGGLSAAERAAAVRSFTSGPPVVLLATDAASEGLNLHHRCRLVIHLELPWMPTRIEQRVGRVDRIGQRLPVHEIRLLARGTVESTVVAPLVARRARRAAETLASLRPGLADEGSVAELVFGPADANGTDDAGAAALPEGLVTGDFRETAAAEARRILGARTLLGAAGAGDDGGRPYAAALRVNCVRGYAAFRLPFEDADDNVVWETILAAGYLLSRPQAFRRAGDVYEHIAAGRDVLVSAARDGQQIQLHTLRALLARTLAIPIARERALMIAITGHGARLAAGMLQPGLFDRRIEREASAQLETLQETLAACDRRLARLLGRLTVRASAPSPAFTALLR